MIPVVKDRAGRHFVVMSVAVAKKQSIANADLILRDSHQLRLFPVAILGDEFRLHMRAHVSRCRPPGWNRLSLVGRWLHAGILRHLHQVAGRPEDIARRRLLCLSGCQASECEDSEKCDNKTRGREDRHGILRESKDYREGASFAHRNPTSLDAWSSGNPRAR